MQVIITQVLMNCRKLHCVTPAGGSAGASRAHSYRFERAVPKNPLFPRVSEAPVGTLI
jgi:hypothetical protein